MFDFEKVLFVGDTHGDTSNIVNVIIPFCVKNGIKAMFVVGDFQYWEHTNYGERHLLDVNKYLIRNDLWLFWLDGNHENHTKLRAEYFNEEHTTVDGFIKIRDRIYHSPRGHAFTWNGVNFMTFGGAYSIDKDDRVPLKSWWPEETISNEDLSKALSYNGLVDILLTHDTLYGYNEIGKTYKSCKDAEINRYFILEVAKHFNIKLNIHGHYHFRHTGYFDDDTIRVKIESLASNISPLDRQVLIFDTEEFKKEFSKKGEIDAQVDPV